MRNIFLENPWAKFGAEASPRPKSKFSISLHQQFEVLYSLFLLYGQVEIYQKILTLMYWTLLLLNTNLFLKNKYRSETSLPATFSAQYLKKSVRHALYPINCPNLILWLRLALEILSKMCIVITCFPVFDAIKFENILCFITSHFLHQLLKG